MNITLDHGCGRGFTFHRKSPTGAPIDCTGGSLAAEIRAEPGGPLLGAFTFYWINQGNGVFAMRINAATVNAIPDGTYRYDIVFTDSNGEPIKLRSGSIIKQGTITE